jgi:excisionase family DNA binding protein
MLDYLKTPEAAAYTRLSVPTLERKRLHGDGPPFVKAGKSVIYRRADLDDWMASRLVRSTSEAA